jgi:Nucleotidyltransferase domain
VARSSVLSVPEREKYPSIRWNLATRSVGFEANQFVGKTLRTMKTSNGQDSEHLEFRRWVYSLTHSQLLNAMEFSPYIDGPANTSHEYDLFIEMIRLQPPPLCPIHPRAVPYNVASAKGKTDGRNPTLQVLRNRMQQPRLFQFFISETNSNNSYMPSLIPRASNGAAAVRRRGGTKQRNGKRVASFTQEQRFEVIARKHVTEWGDVMSVGCTDEQQAADEKILAYTLVDPKLAGDPKAQTFISFGVTSDERRSSDLLRLLQVASRGYFLSINHHQRNHTSHYAPAFCAPWLDPTSRWFSLPMYIASRFEVALWDSFSNQRRVWRLQRNRPWENLQERLTEPAIQVALQRAMLQVLTQNIMRQDVEMPPSNLRDGLLFDLLESIEFWRARAKSPNSFYKDHTPKYERCQWLSGISGSPVVEIGTTTHRIRLYVRQQLQVEICKEMERHLLDRRSFRDLQTGVATAPHPTQRSKKKKQRRKVARKRQPAFEPRIKTDTQEDGSSGDESDTEANRAKPIRSDENIRLCFPENGTPFVERNRNIILCLAMLNDVVNNAFRQVGLEVSSDESDLSVKHGNKSRHGGSKAGVHKASASTSRNAAPKSKPTLKTGRKEEEEKLTKLDVCYTSVHNQDNDDEPRSAPGSVDTFPSQQGFFLRNGPFDPNPWGFYSGGDDWSGSSSTFLTREPRERSILAEFFLEQERADAYRLERITASSTAASLASSTDKTNEDTSSISDKFFISLDNGIEPPASDIASTVISAEDFPSLDIYHEEIATSADSEEGEVVSSVHESDAELERDQLDSEKKGDIAAALESRSISPEAPATPSPRLSPILLSLDDLRDIRKGAKSVGTGAELEERLRVAAPTVPSSLPSSPVEQSKRRLVSSLSREDLRLTVFRDDQGFVPKTRRATAGASTGSPSYLNVAAGVVKVAAVRSMSFSKSVRKDTRSSNLQKEHRQEVCARSENAAELHDESHNSSGAPSYRNVAAKSISGGSLNAARNVSDVKRAAPGKNQSQGDLCARSETAVEGHEEYQHWHDSRRSRDDNNPDNITVGKDGSTTITSAMSHRESEETSHLREELKNFRDLVLTLGAEVAKLKNQMAAQHGRPFYPSIDFSQGYVRPVHGGASFDPECMPPFFQKGQALGAMSDAGVQRGEYESQVSEDDELLGKGGYGDGRRVSLGATIAGSDISIEPTNSNHALQGPVGLPAPMSRDAHGENGLQTRLTEDILRFLTATEMQHRKLDGTRDLAVERITRLVNALWPRAQVKLYGSHVTSLCLPSSDMDFVICLPAVRKNAPAVAPGALEGRNAINESSQKLLARKLKGESWIDPRSMKLIERTVVPVIKVATKDTRARTIHLDISFDSPEHHGLEAIVMVKQILGELPMIRPLVLILKQFLLDRALLTAYTGGLSSYCLFLMAARYLQEQPSSWGDCGSLLMGFLDFYGK